ncbi:MAG: hypothetical protein K6A23_00660, partial [Butyrivibrio sp.]|nr:hypothetical protein [Butyrivibrio sp.]
MLLYSRIYIAFFACVCIAFYAINSCLKNNIKLRLLLSQLLILLASLAFYAFGGIGLLKWLVYIIGITYAYGIVATKNSSKYVYVFFVILQLFPLILFKYNSYAGYIGIPLGLSFYTLQAVTYATAVYKGKIENEKSPVV